MLKYCILMGKVTRGFSYLFCISRSVLFLQLVTKLGKMFLDLISLLPAVEVQSDKKRYVFVNEPAYEIMALFGIRKSILQTRMRSHPVGLDV